MRLLTFILAALTLSASKALAGMPTFVLTDVAKARLDSISFFLFVYLVCAVIFRWLWNLLAMDFPWMPKLTLGRSVALLVVVGLFMYFILTMISGARELMTPGAWFRDGAGYRLTPSSDLKPWLESARQRSLEHLRDALRDYATKHDGKLPAHPFVSDFDSRLWQGIDPAGAWFGYIQGCVLATDNPQVLAYEPPSYGPRRWVLLTDGSILQMDASALEERIRKEFVPHE